MAATSTGESCKVFFSDSHVSQLTRSLYDLLKNDVACNIVFTNTKGTNHIAHSVVLCAASKFLQRLIAAAKCESASEIKDKVFVTVDGVHDESITSILKFIYTGEMLLKDYTIKEVYEKCIEWELGEAVKICRRYLQTLPKDYVIDTLGLGTALNAIEKEQNINQKSAQKSHVDDLLHRHAKLTYYPKTDDIVIRENVQELIDTVYDDDIQDDDEIKDDITCILLSDDVQNKLNDCDIRPEMSPAKPPSDIMNCSLKQPVTEEPSDMTDVKKKRLETLSRKWNKRQTKALIPWLEKDSIVVIPSPYSEAFGSQQKKSLEATESVTPSNDMDTDETQISTDKNKIAHGSNDTDKALQHDKSAKRYSAQDSAVGRQDSLNSGITTRLRRRSSKLKSADEVSSSSDRKTRRRRKPSLKSLRFKEKQNEAAKLNFEQLVSDGANSIPENVTTATDTQINSVNSKSKSTIKEVDLGDKDYEDDDMTGESESEEKALPPKKRLRRAQYASNLDAVENNGPYCCSHCKKLFKYRTSFHKHVTICEKDKSKDSTESSECVHPCKQCEKICSSAEDLKSHMLVHDKPFVCDQCDYRTRRQARLAEHQYRKHGFPLENAGLEIYACKVSEVQYSHPIRYMGDLFKLTCNGFSLVMITNDVDFRKKAARLRLCMLV